MINKRSVERDGRVLPDIIRRSINLVVAFLVLVLTVSLLGETMDKILTDNIRQEVVGSLIDSKIKFQSAADQAYVNQQIQLRIKNLGLDEPWYAPKRFLNTIFKVMILDLGRSFTTSDNGFEVIDIIAERIPGHYCYSGVRLSLPSLLGYI